MNRRTKQKEKKEHTTIHMRTPFSPKIKKTHIREDDDVSLAHSHHHLEQAQAGLGLAITSNVAAAAAADA